MKRNTYDIYMDMLTLAQTPRNKTFIMYQCNLSYSQLQKHLTSLKQADFLHNGDGKYQTTAKGAEYIKVFHEIRKLMGEWVSLSQEMKISV